MKIRYLTLLVLCMLAAIASAQNIVIPGTKVSLTPPDGFIPSTTFSGFQNEKQQASILVAEVPAPLAQIVASFTVETLKLHGMTLIRKEPVQLLNIKLNDGKAFFIELSQSAMGATYLKQIVVFGDAGKTIMVNGIYPELNKILAPAIKDALLSASYNEQQKTDPLAAVNFTINTDGTPFKFASFFAGGLSYNTDGEKVSNSPSVVVGPLLSTVPIGQQKDLSQKMLKSLPHQQTSEIKTIEPIQIGNLSGYEVVAEGKNKDDKPELVYMVTLFNSDVSYMIVCEATTDYDKYLPMFKKISLTFKLK